MTGKTSKGVAVNVRQHYFDSPGILPLSFLFTVDRSPRFCLVLETTFTGQMPGCNGLATSTYKQTWRNCTRNATKRPCAMSELRPCTATCVVQMRGLVRTFLIVLIYYVMLLKFHLVVLNWDSTDIALQKSRNHSIQKRTFSTKSNENCLHKY